jgi:hypothetical protein
VGHHRDEWLRLPAVAAVRAKASNQVHSILNRFALVAAALRMAIEAKLLPWSIDETDRGVAACMARCLGSRNGRLDLTGEVLGAVEQIRVILAADLHGRFIHQRVIDANLDYANPADATKRHTTCGREARPRACPGRCAQGGGNLTTIRRPKLISDWPEGALLKGPTSNAAARFAPPRRSFF